MSGSSASSASSSPGKIGISIDLIPSGPYGRASKSRETSVSQPHSCR